MTAKRDFSSPRPQKSPAELAARVRRAARAIQDGIEIQDLMRQRGFTTGEIAKAQAMLTEKER